MSIATDLFKYHRRMYQDRLVVGTSGNISGRVPGGKNMLIKPSGVEYADLTPESMVAVDIATGRWHCEAKPSTDTVSHLVIYRELSLINAVIHTHSTFATAWAATGRPVPVVLTAHADEFGDPIPCAGYAEIGGKEVGQAVLKFLNRAGVVLVANHGLFAVADTVAHAYKKALMAEDVIRTTYYALQMDAAIEPLSKVRIESAYGRYHTSYGQ